MHDRLQKTTNMPRCTQKVDGLRFGVSVLALSFSLGISSIASAQTNLIVDLADPNVSVDLSVLNDGGLSPQMGAPMTGAPAAMGYGDATYQEPGKDTPISTLYIKPSNGFKLPPQTKPIETTFAAAPQPSKPNEAMAEDVVVAPVEVTPVEVAVAPTTPPPLAMPKPVAAPVTAPPAPAPVTTAVVEPAAPAPIAPEAIAVQTPPAPVAKEPAEDVAALMPSTQVAPTPAPAPASQPMALNSEVQAEPASEPAAEGHDVAAAPTPPPPVAEQAIPTAPMPPKAGEVVIPLPPRDDAPAEVASLPPATGPLSDGDSLRIVFDAETSKLPQTARESLLNMATEMRTQDNLRLQLLAYAGNADSSSSAARRLSLSRALAVRSFLIENGVRSTRIDVRALGNKSTDAITERVDITVVER